MVKLLNKLIFITKLTDNEAWSVTCTAPDVSLTIKHNDASVWRRAFENLSTAVMLIDRAGILRLMNPAAEALLATSANQTIGTPATPLFGSGKQRIHQALERAFERDHPITEREMDIRLATGDGIIVDCTMTPTEEPGTGRAVLVELHPIDHMLRIRRDEVRANQQLTTNAVVRGLAHEINNPLGGIRGAAQLLQRELADKAQREFTQVIIAEADRLRNLLQRMTGPTTLPQPRQCNVHEITERVHTLARAEAITSIEFIRDYDPSIPDLRADPELLIQALLNMVRNAVQALRDQGVITIRTRTRRQVVIGTKRHRIAAAVQVMDTGPGVPTELVEKLFFPMVTGRPDGTGLGLSIAQSLVKQHHGIIEFESKPGQTVFTILLPLDGDHYE